MATYVLFPEMYCDLVFPMETRDAAADVVEKYMREKRVVRVSDGELLDDDSSKGHLSLINFGALTACSVSEIQGKATPPSELGPRVQIQCFVTDGEIEFLATP